MAKPILHFKSKHTGQMKKAPVGYSWTMLFFGWFVPLLRGDWKSVFVLMLTYALAIGIVSTFAPEPAAAVAWVNLIVGFIYNKQYIKSLVTKGFEVTSVENGEIDAVETKLGLTLPVQVPEVV